MNTTCFSRALIELATQSRDSICDHPPRIRLDFAPFLRQKVTIWCWLSAGLAYAETIIHLSDSARQISTTINLHLGE